MEIDKETNTAKNTTENESTGNFLRYIASASQA
jgi:hypothetical protein